jgi:hypothetical protein
MADGTSAAAAAQAPHECLKLHEDVEELSSLEGYESPHHKAAKLRSSASRAAKTASSSKPEVPLPLAAAASPTELEVSSSAAPPPAVAAWLELEEKGEASGDAAVLAMVKRGRAAVEASWGVASSRRAKRPKKESKEEEAAKEEGGAAQAEEAGAPAAPEVAAPPTSADAAPAPKAKARAAKSKAAPLVKTALVEFFDDKEVKDLAKKLSCSNFFKRCRAQKANEEAEQVKAVREQLAGLRAQFKKLADAGGPGIDLMRKVSHELAVAWPEDSVGALLSAVEEQIKKEDVAAEAGAASVGAAAAVVVAAAAAPAAQA